MTRFPQRVIAHRGASHDAPENTLAAFRLAAEQGIQWVEFDVMLSRDKVPVVIHDLTLNRTTNANGKVADFTVSELQEFDAGSWKDAKFANEKIPTLEEVLIFLQSAGLSANIEIKPNLNQEIETADAVLECLKQNWRAPQEKILLTSFAILSVKTAMERAPEWSRGLLLTKWNEPWKDLATLYQVKTIHGPQPGNRQEIQAMKQAGYEVLAYTVDDENQAKELFDMGVSAIFSNRAKAMLVTH